MILLRTAVLMAFSSEPLARWRQVMVILTSFLGAACLLTGAGLVQSSARGSAVERERGIHWASDPATAPLVGSMRAIEVDGHQWPVVWLEARGPVTDGVTLAPPGLRRLPGAGEAVLSPGLIARGITAESLGMRSSAAGSGPGGTIGDEGLKSGTEGLIYAAPALGRSLGSGGALLALSGYGGSDGQDPAPIETSPDIPSFVEAAVGALLLLVGPACYLVVSGARAVSPIRAHRAAVLHRLGVGGSRIRRLMGLEGAVLAVVGSLGGLVLWATWLRGVRRWPGTGAELIPGATNLSVPVAAGICAFVVSIAALSSGAVRVPQRPLAESARRRKALTAAPMLTALALMAAARWTSWDSPLRLTLLVGGAIAFLASVPGAVPAVASWLRPALGVGRGGPVWLAQQRLGLRSASLSRPAMLVAVLVFVAGAGFALYEFARTVEPERQLASDTPLVATVSWRDHRPGEAGPAVERLRRLGAGVGVVSAADADKGGPVWVACADAQTMARLLHQDGRCTSQGVSPALSSWLSGSTGGELKVGPTPVDTNQLLLVAPPSLSDALITKALAGMPAVNISRGQIAPMSAAPSGWVMLGWIVAVCLAVTGLIRELGDRALLAVVEDTGLIKLGLSHRELATLHLISLGLPLSVAVVMGWFAAVAFAVVGYGLGITVANLTGVTTAAAVAGAGTLAALGVLVLVQRRVSRMGPA